MASVSLSKHLLTLSYDIKERFRLSNVFYFHIGVHGPRDNPGIEKKWRAFRSLKLVLELIKHIPIIP